MGKMEKRPTLEEVQEYFKDVETVQCTDDSDTYYLDLSQQIDLFKTSVRILNQKDEPYSGVRTYCQLWSEDKGYAKILTYKNNDMKLSKKFIKANADKTLKEVFPDVFVTKLETGKWYKNPNRKAIMFFEKLIGNEVFGYGFNNAGVWEDKLEYFTNHWIEATNDEVFKALKNEAVKRGFVDRCFFQNIHLSYGSVHELKAYLAYNIKTNSLYCNASGWVVFRDGKWATIIETITKEEAEKLLNKKII